MAVKHLSLLPLSEDHLAGVLEIEQKVQTAPWSERSFRNELNHPQGVFLVALISAQVVGYGGIWLVVDEAHITTLAVDPDVQRQGIGRALIQELLKIAVERGMECAMLEVRAGNEAAIKLYESLGFQSCARRKRYYPDNSEDAVVMRLHRLEQPVSL